MGKYYCKVCGKELNNKADECYDCMKADLIRTLDQHPGFTQEFKQAYAETLAELLGPGDPESKVDAATVFMQVITKMRGAQYGE